MVVGDVLRRIYERRLHRAVTAAGEMPRHVGLIMDGNRRWARQVGLDDPTLGHRAGADHLTTVLGWCRELGIADVTVYLASVDNVRKRDSGEVAGLLGLVESVVTEQLTGPDPVWRVRTAGRLDVLPDSTARALKAAEEHTRDRGPEANLTIAIGYDGRLEIVDAVRAWLDTQARDGVDLAGAASRVTVDAIDRHVIGTPGGDPDLIIRTSGEQRLSGFLLWRSPGARLYFCDTYWPGFRRIELLRVLRDHQRRRGR